MASLDQLPADQRAVLQLLLKQGRTYENLSSVLRVDAGSVRERAHAALGAMGPQAAALSPDRQEELSDYLLGQLPDSERARTRDFLAGSAAGRGWARVVADGLRPLSGDRLPEIPEEGERDDGGAAEDTSAVAPAAQPAREERRAGSAERDDRAPSGERDEAERSSRIGGILLLAGLGIALAVVVVLLVTGGDDGGGEQPEQPAQAPPEILAQQSFLPPEGSDSEALGAGQLIRQQNQLALRVVAQGLPSASEQRVYAFWLTNGDKQSAQLLGYPTQQPTDQQPLLAFQTGLPPEALRFSQIIATRESGQETAQRPGEIVLQAPLTGDAQGQQPPGGGGQQQPPAGGGQQQPPGGGAQQPGG